MEGQDAWKKGQCWGLQRSRWLCQNNFVIHCSLQFNVFSMICQFCQCSVSSVNVLSVLSMFGQFFSVIQVVNLRFICCKLLFTINGPHDLFGFSKLSNFERVSPRFHFRLMPWASFHNGARDIYIGSLDQIKGGMREGEDVQRVKLNMEGWNNVVGLR